MSLVSQLLKHHIIAETCDVTFNETIVSRHPEHGKPCYLPSPSSTATRSVAFNVSHQAGLVALIAIPKVGKEEYDVGIDIVCVNERSDFEKIMASSNPRNAYNEFIDMHAEVFSPKEIEELKMEEGEVEGEKGLSDGNSEIEKRMRRFYALWCLREAYVKMTGEALLAEWLGELKFRKFVVPDEEECESKLGKALEEGLEIYFKGERVKDVKMRIMALGSKYMVASAVRRRDGGAVDVEWMELEEISVEDVVRRARAAV